MFNFMLYLSQKKGKERGPVKKNPPNKKMTTWEVIINNKTIYAGENKAMATALFDFYRKEKALFKIYEIIIMNGEEHFFFEG